MFGRKIPVFKLLGFQVSIDLSWIVIAVLVSWSLSTGFFPFRIKGLSPGTYWAMGIVGALGLFASIVAHEFAHSLVARRVGLPMKGITLFIFGGVSEMEDEPQSAGAELAIAVVGPISSIVIAGAFYLAWLMGRGTLSTPVNGVLGYLAMINALLAGFNLLPAFPLDGGRVLRSILWKTRGDLKSATRTASRVGAGFGLGLILLGILNIVSGGIVGGMWYVLIGLFLRGAAQMSFSQMMVRQALSGEPVSRFMKTNVVTVPPDLPVTGLVEDYLYRFHHKLYPVVAPGGRLAGCVSTREIKNLPREQWDATQVRDLASACTGENTIRPDADAMDALSLMNRSGVSRLLVVRDGELAGILTMKDLMEFLAMKVEMEG